MQYTIDLDHTVWIPIPLYFPWNGYETDERWATDLASSLLGGLGAEPDVEQQLVVTALAVARTSGPLPGAIERFWHFPEFGGPERVIHLYIAEYRAPDADEDLREIVTAGLGGFVQRAEAVADTPFDRAVSAVIIVTPDAETDAVPGSDVTEAPVADVIYAARFLGFAGGLVYIIELVERDATVLEQMLEPMEALFRSIRLQPA